jgi:long-chain acyl-CoA synthetase
MPGMAKSIIGTFEETVQKRGSNPAARYREAGDRWVTKTWLDMDKERKALAAGLLQLGLQPKERVNVLSGTTYRWMLADLAIQSCAGECVAIYQSNLPHECEYIVNDCRAAMAFVENKDQLQKLLEVKAKIPQVRKVVVMDDNAEAGDWTIKFSDVVKMGEAKVQELEAKLKERTALVAPEDVLTLIYTSGTTGNPKGVVLTHSNLLYEIDAVKRVGLIHADDLELIFLPLAHSFAKVLQCVWFGLGHEMAIDSDIQKITQNLGIVRPTVMAAVPRIFEKVYAKVVQSGLERTGVAGKLFRWALSMNDQYAQHMIDGKPVPFGVDVQLQLARAIVFKKVGEKLRETFGGRLRYFVSGGAPLPKKMAYFFENVGVVILEGYGLTETSAATTCNRPEKNKIGTVGPAFPGTELKIAPDGEILIRGPGVMREYWNRGDATKEVMSPDGWFSTGDIGVIDHDGYLKITDRKKDIIVTAGGKNVAPQNIENLVKATSPLVSQVMVHGDKRNYLVALVTVDPENAMKFAKEKGISNGDYATIARSKEVESEIGDVMKKVNAQLASYETIKKFKVLERDFEIGQELTPTLKVKRKFANEKYREILDKFYAEKVE